MKDSVSSKADKMSLKKLDNDIDRAYWEAVEKAAREWRERQPTWSRDLDRERRPQQARESGERQVGRAARCVR
jgi:hypothetical protein